MQYYMMIQLLRCLIEQDSGVARDLKAKIREGLAKRFGVNSDGKPIENTVENSPLILTMAVDPRYKSLKILTTEQRQLIRDKILREIQLGDICPKVTPPIKVKTEEGEEPPVKKRIVDCLMGGCGY